MTAPVCNCPCHPEPVKKEGDDGLIAAMCPRCDWRCHFILAYKARAEAAEAENRCDVCDGRPLESGRECMCGGTRKKSAAVQYLRERVVTLEAALRERDAEIERLTRERDEAREVATVYAQHDKWLEASEVAESRRLLEEAVRSLNDANSARDLVVRILAHLAGGEQRVESSCGPCCDRYPQGMRDVLGCPCSCHLAGGER